MQVTADALEEARVVVVLYLYIAGDRARAKAAAPLGGQIAIHDPQIGDSDPIQVSVPTNGGNRQHSVELIRTQVAIDAADMHMRAIRYAQLAAMWQVGDLDGGGCLCECLVRRMPARNADAHAIRSPRHGQVARDERNLDDLSG
jgi:hypothetical protein